MMQIACRLSRTLKLALGLAAAMAVAEGVAANPLGGQVVGGNASIAGQGTPGVVVNQSSQSAIINWQSFNILPGEQTRFIQPNAASVVLNRVTGDKSPSSIMGSLSANGRVFLVNPEGFIFGPNATINTAAFLATTHDIRNEDFLAGHYTFDRPGNPKASIVNQGTITVADTGIAALVAPAVRNDGIITARLGKVALAAGNGFALDLYGDNLITFALNDAIAAQVVDVATGKPIKALVDNKGTLSADGGTVAMTAVTARGLVDSVINTSGVVEARSVGVHNGKIVLGAATARTKTAGAPSQKIKVSGKLDVSGTSAGERGGKIVVSGETIEVAHANIDASGVAGGGAVLIGGDTGGGTPNPAAASIVQAKLDPQPIDNATSVSIDDATTVSASATVRGDGGKVVVWSDGATDFSGAVSARGARGGRGGFAEVSGHETLAFGGRADLGSDGGVPGTLLLDPKDVTIGTSGTWIVTPTAIQTALASGNVIVNTSAAGTDAGDITVAQSVSWNNANTLTLSANRNIVVGNGVMIANTSSGSLVLRADDTGSGTGTVAFSGSGKIDFSGSTGTVSILYNPAAGYTSPTDYTPFVLTDPAVPSQLLAYMLVNNVNDLQNIQQSLSGTYALGKDIDASATATWNSGAGFAPIGTSFNGMLDGNRHTIDQLTIYKPSTDAGLFAEIGASGVVRNLGLTNISVISNNFVGGIAGSNFGSILDSFVAGSVSSFSSIISTGSAGEGLLVGTNGGAIARSYALGTVQGPSGYAGGLAGLNNGPSASITQSYADVSVSSGPACNGCGSYVGGLVGHNLRGSITQSYALGAVTVSAAAFPFSAPYTGGLVAVNNGAIAESYATGVVSGDGNTVTGGLVGTNSNFGVFFIPIGSVATSYWDTQASGQLSSGGGTGLLTSQLKAGLPTGFNVGVWGSNAGINGYPYLLWQTAALPNALVLSGSNPTPVTLFYVADGKSSQYGQSLPSLTGTVVGFLSGDTLATATTGTLTFTTAASSTSNVGSYAITGSGLTAIGNYIFAQAIANATALAITPAPLTITADILQKTYGATLNFSGSEFTTSALVTGDSVSSVSLTSPGAAATASVTGGPYAITASNAVGTGLGNYSITYVPGALMVNTKAITVRANDATKPVGSTLNFSGSEFTTAGLVNGDTVNSVTLSSLGASALATVAGNPYTITASNAQGSGLDNYAISYAPGNLIVTTTAPTPASLLPFIQDPTGQMQIKLIQGESSSAIALASLETFPGGILFTSAPVEDLMRRNALGLEYAFSNDTFQDQVAALVFSKAPVPGLSRLLSQEETKLLKIVTGGLRKAWASAVETYQGDYFKALTNITPFMLDVFVKRVAPQYGTTLDAAKVVAAFTTAYVYGFVWGQ